MILFINMDKSLDRASRMRYDFAPSMMKRFCGIDGIEKWGDGTFDTMGRPRWNVSGFEELIKNGIVHEKSMLTPAELGCSLSHLRSWERFLGSSESDLIVLEDDVQPTTFLRGRTLEQVIEDRPWPQDADIVHFCSPAHPGRRIVLYQDGQIRAMRTHMGYWMSRRGAELAVQAMKPILYMPEWQVGMRIFAIWAPKCEYMFPEDMEALPLIKAYGMFEPLIEHNSLAKVTTFTCNGRKDWLEPEDHIV